MKTLKIGVLPHGKGIIFLLFYENIANLGYIKPLIWRKNIFPINACETIVLDCTIVLWFYGLHYYFTLLLVLGMYS